MWLKTLGGLDGTYRRGERRSIHRTRIFCRRRENDVEPLKIAYHMFPDPLVDCFLPKKSYTHIYDQSKV